MPPRARPLVIAHRGANEVIAEHTVGAYRAAVAARADALECDVRLTADRELVCLHDRTAARTSNGRAVISTQTLAELEALDWGGWKYGPGTDAGIAADPDNRRLITLRQLIELAVEATRSAATGQETGLAVETKHPSRYGGQLEHAVAAMAGRFDLAAERGHGVPWLRVMSSSWLAVRRWTSLRPDIPSVFLTETKIPTPARYGALPGGASAAGIDIEIVRRVPDMVVRQRAHGHDVYVWTVDEPADVTLCLELAVAGIITNRPQAVMDQIAHAG
ncbi:MAG TPA: glycerophosphodiester phosphodiesterase family protein [Candidatus Lustribacter sp.]|nr:glycerophosphodiester phosphodiesterase family protein [Candidatus Lustribacter sp.]